MILHNRKKLNKKITVDHKIAGVDFSVACPTFYDEMKFWKLVSLHLH